MDRSEKVTLTNACMIVDSLGRAVVEKQDKYGPSGLVFPGGHVEHGESIVDSVIREVREETGLTLRKVTLCGVKDYREDDGSRYMVFLFRSDDWEGDLTSSDEGEVFWAPIDKLSEMNMLWHLDTALPIFLGKGPGELYFGSDGIPVLK